MIRVSKQAIRGAFEAFRSRRGEWGASIGAPAAEGGQLQMYRAAASAFGGNRGLDEFQKVYDGLRKWKVFRKGRVQSAEWVFGNISSLPGTLRGRRLSELGEDSWKEAWKAILVLREVKVNKTGPSVMAISKFLHFWNPSVFVICDQAEVEQFVFGHRWLADQLAGTDAVLGAVGTDARREPHLSKYLRVLVFASQFVGTNPDILSEFARTVRELAPDGAVPDDIETYEATAAEWCLIGLAEMPPSGIELSGGRA